MLNNKVTVVANPTIRMDRVCMLKSARGFRLRLARSALAAAVASLLPLYAAAQVGQGMAPEIPVAYTVRDFDLPAGSLAAGLEAFSTQSGIRFDAQPGLLEDKQARAVSGRMGWHEALDELLQGSGLVYQQMDDKTIVVRASDPAPSNAGRSAPPASARLSMTLPNSRVTEMEALTVTGTRIRGGATPSPVIVIGAENIREEGFTDLGEVIRSVPQNFGGGQNPGVIGTSGNSSNGDFTGGSALNLRGLGPDASLTLLNGRRLAYDGSSQAVDISAIPVEAVERVEIVPDGASAIYGSDAVGGVANVVLKRDFDGVTLGARYGRATDGGLATREYTATAGTIWSSGGLIVTLKDASADPIYAHQRSYTDHLAEPYTIYNAWDSRSGLVSLHQTIGDVAELRLDALRTERETTKYVTQSGAYQQYVPEASVALVSPSIEFFLPHDWSVTVGGSYGKNEAIDERHLVSATASRLVADTSFYNKNRSYEMGAEGPLFSIGGGDARLAIGFGSRTEDFLNLSHITGARYGGDERARYAYAEFNLPVVSPSAGITGVRRLEFSAALRAEDYDSFGRVTTPKLGAIYSPSADLTLKVSWGKSFKVPMAVQRYQDKMAFLWSAAATGGSGYPPDATVLMSWGGNADLNAERARTWAASLAVHPEAFPGFEAELTAFGVDYTDRVVVPVNYQQALSNPAYAEFVDYSPTPEQQADLLAVYNSAFYNLSGLAYDPSHVVAIAYGQFLNAASQRIKGLDLSGSYRFGFGDGQLTVRGSTSWLESTQKTSSSQPEFALAGTAFNPAKVNSRVGAVWASGGFSASGFANYTSGVTNQLATTKEKTASFTTMDTTLGYDTGERAGTLSGLTIGLSVRNLLNREPPLYTVRNANFVPYDATNYSAIGRFVSVSVSKRW